MLCWSASPKRGRYPRRAGQEVPSRRRAGLRRHGPLSQHFDHRDVWRREHDPRITPAGQRPDVGPQDGPRRKSSPRCEPSCGALRRLSSTSRLSCSMSCSRNTTRDGPRAATARRACATGNNRVTEESRTRRRSRRENGRARAHALALTRAKVAGRPRAAVAMSIPPQSCGLRRLARSNVASCGGRSVWAADGDG